MLLRYLLENYVRSAAGSKLREALAQALSGIGGDEGNTQKAKQSGPDFRDTQELAPPCDAAVIFALNAESGGLLDLLEKPTTTKVDGFVEHAGQLDGKEIVLVESGVGSEAVAKAVASVIQFHHPRWIISTGFAGALHPALKQGDMVQIDSVTRETEPAIDLPAPVNAETQAIFQKWSTGKLLTVDKVVRTTKKKDRLYRETEAVACDMETYAVAQVCKEMNVPLLAIRIISDSVDQELPAEIEAFLGKGSIATKLGAAAKALWGRPQAALDLWRLHDDSLKLSDKLGKRLAKLLLQL